MIEAQDLRKARTEYRVLRIAILDARSASDGGEKYHSRVREIGDTNRYSEAGRTSESHYILNLELNVYSTSHRGGKPIQRYI